MADDTDFMRSRKACITGIKAYQNVRAAQLTFEQLLSLSESKDFITISALFHTGVIRYAKPFLESESDSGTLRYPTKHLKHIPGYSAAVHQHLLEIRNTLIAHDDFTQIEPRILIFGVTPRGVDLTIPTSIVVANKCISHPADTTVVQQFLDQAKAVSQGIQNRLHDDISALRQIEIQHPDQAKQATRYAKDYGTVEIAAGGTRMNPPKFQNDEWLDNREPDFSELHNGFRYESLRVNVDFHGPEEIQLPDGRSFHLTP